MLLLTGLHCGNCSKNANPRSGLENVVSCLLILGRAVWPCFPRYFITLPGLQMGPRFCTGAFKNTRRGSCIQAAWLIIITTPLPEQQVFCWRMLTPSEPAVTCVLSSPHSAVHTLPSTTAGWWFRRDAELILTCALPHQPILQPTVCSGNSHVSALLF